MTSSEETLLSRLTCAGWVILPGKYFSPPMHYRTKQDIPAVEKRFIQMLCDSFGYKAIRAEETFFI